MSQNTYLFAGFQAIFVLSGDKELAETGDKSRIEYKEWHNYYRQLLLTGGTWADGVFAFFNNSLFSASSSATATLFESDVGDSGPRDTWEDDFEHAMEHGGELPNLVIPPSSDVQHFQVEAPPGPGLIPQSISTAMQDLALREDSELPVAAPVAPTVPEALQGVVLDSPAVLVTEKPKPKPKPKRRGKAAANNTDVAEDSACNTPADATVSGIRRSGRSKSTK